MAKSRLEIDCSDRNYEFCTTAGVIMGNSGREGPILGLLVVQRADRLDTVGGRGGGEQVISAHQFTQPT